MRAIVETNFFGVVRMIQAVVPAMRAHGSGVIVNVSSLAGRVAPPLGGFYAASKFALEGLARRCTSRSATSASACALVEPGVFATAFQGKERTGSTVGPPYDELEAEWERRASVLGRRRARRAGGRSRW